MVLVLLSNRLYFYSGVKMNIEMSNLTLAQIKELGVHLNMSPKAIVAVAVHHLHMTNIPSAIEAHAKIVEESKKAMANDETSNLYRDKT